MVGVNTQVLKDDLSSYLHRVEAGERFVVLHEGKKVAALVSPDLVIAAEEADHLTKLEARGLLVRPEVEGGQRFRTPLTPSRGKPASKMVIEDRR
jgi:antitoxin (DNA-binding transcriptional repressor) of toxin-antitoxin stability system